MPRIILFVLILATLSFAYTDKRIDEFKSFLNSLDNKNSMEKINMVNFYFNQIVQSYDSYENNTDDIWDSAIDFIIQGKGDCEEFAISKYEVLKRKGVDKDRLFLMVVSEYRCGQTPCHLVTAYYEQDQNPLILDNLSFRILPLNQRSDRQPIMIFNDKESFWIDKEGKKTTIVDTPFPQRIRELEQKLDAQLKKYQIKLK